MTRFWISARIINKEFGSFYDSLKYAEKYFGFDPLKPYWKAYDKFHYRYYIQQW
jgi:hypothetical protein